MKYIIALILCFTSTANARNYFDCDSKLDNGILYCSSDGTKIPSEFIAAAPIFNKNISNIFPKMKLAKRGTLTINVVSRTKANLQKMDEQYFIRSDFGMYSETEHKIIIFNNSGIGTLFHEMMHSVSQPKYNWQHEGTPMLFEKSYYNGKTLSIGTISQWRILKAKKTLDLKAILSKETLSDLDMTINPNEYASRYKAYTIALFLYHNNLITNYDSIKNKPNIKFAYNNYLKHILSIEHYSPLSRIFTNQLELTKYLNK